MANKTSDLVTTLVDEPVANGDYSDKQLIFVDPNAQLTRSSSWCSEASTSFLIEEGISLTGSDNEEQNRDTSLVKQPPVAEDLTSASFGRLLSKFFTKANNLLTGVAGVHADSAAEDRLLLFPGRTKSSKQPLIEVECPSQVASLASHHLLRLPCRLNARYLGFAPADGRQGYMAVAGPVQRIVRDINNDPLLRRVDGCTSKLNRGDNVAMGGLGSHGFVNGASRLMPNVWLVDEKLLPFVEISVDAKGLFVMQQVPLIGEAFCDMGDSLSDKGNAGFLDETQNAVCNLHLQLGQELCYACQDRTYASVFIIVQVLQNSNSQMVDASSTTKWLCHAFLMANQGEAYVAAMCVAEAFRASQSTVATTATATPLATSTSMPKVSASTAKLPFNAPFLSSQNNAWSNPHKKIFRLQPVPVFGSEQGPNGNNDDYDSEVSC